MERLSIKGGGEGDVLEKERGKLPRVDCNAVDELNAYVTRHRQYRNDDLEYLHIYIFGLEELRLSPIGDEEYFNIDHALPSGSRM